MEDGYYVRLEDEDEHLLPHHHHQDPVPTSLLVSLYIGHFLARWGARCPLFLSLNIYICF